MSVLRTLYPPIEPYEIGMFDVGDGHTTYYERVDTPGAKPAVFLHGGPGGGIPADYCRVSDPACYDVMPFDQRGCGRSTPHGGLEANTIWHPVVGIERLRAIAGVDRWSVLGGSWGSTLALAYVQKCPQHVSELVLRGIYTVTQAELRWYYQYGVSEMFPEKQARFQASIPEAERGDAIAAYRKVLTGNNTARQIKAARAWSVWEGETITLLPDPASSAEHVDDHFALVFARLESHYFTHQCWLEEGQLLRKAHGLTDIPGVIVHGRYDIPCPAHYAYALHQVWPDLDFHLIGSAGHAWSELGILDQLLAATDRFAGK